jgi:hypothetical protein
MAKSLENSNGQIQESKLGVGDKLRQFKEGVIKAYEAADQAVIKATTFDSKKVMKDLKRSVVLAIGVSAVGMGAPNMHKANAANNESTTIVPTIEQIVTNEANKSDSGVSKGGIAKGLNSVMRDGKFTDKEVATFVEARNSANGFRDKNKNTTDTNSILEKVKSGKNILEATSEVVFSSSEAKSQAAKDAAAGTKTDAEIYGKLVVDAQQSILKKQAEQKSTVTPSTKPEVKKNETKPNGESKLPALNRVDPDPISFLPKITEQNNGVFARISSADDTIQSLELMTPVNAQMKEPFIVQAKPETGIKWDVKPVDVSKQKEQVENAVKKNPNLSSREIFDIIYNESAKDIALTPDQLKELKSSVATKIKALREFYTNPNRSNQGILLPLYSNILDDFNKVVGKAQVEKVDSVNRADYDEDMKSAALVALGGGLVVGAGVGSIVFLLRGNKRLKIANDRIALQDKKLATNLTQITSLDNTITQRNHIIARKDVDINNLDAEVAQNREDLEVRDIVIENLNDTNNFVDGLIDENDKLKETNTELVKGLSDIRLIEKILKEQSQEKDVKIESLEETVTKLMEALDAMRQEIAKLNSKVNEQPAKQSGLLEKARNKVGQIFGRNKTSVDKSEVPAIVTPVVEALQPEIAKVDKSENEPEITIEPLPQPKHAEPVQFTPLTEQLSQPEPISAIEPLPKSEMSTVEISAKIEEIIDGLYDRLINNVDRLREQSKRYKIDSILRDIQSKIDKSDIISNYSIANDMLKTLLDRLIDSGEYEYQENKTRLAPTKKPEIVQPQVEPVVAPAIPEIPPQVYSSPNAVPTTTIGHRNIGVNDPAVGLTAYNTGIGFIPQSEPSKPLSQFNQIPTVTQTLVPKTQISQSASVNSAPAAPSNQPESSQPQVISKSQEQIQSEEIFDDKVFGNINEANRIRILAKLNLVDRAELIEVFDVYHKIRDENLSDNQKNKLAELYFRQL